jgi:hypothetical protein
MIVVGLISASILIKQLFSLNDIDHYRQYKPTYLSLLENTMIVLTTLFSYIAFGPPVAPALVTYLFLFIMLCVSEILPGLIDVLNHMLSWAITFGLSIEYMVHGKTYG